MKISIPMMWGEQPKRSPTILEAGMAQHAVNCKLEGGNIDSIGKPAKEQDLALSAVQSIFVYTENGNDNWVETAEDVNIVPSPVDNDTFERLYFTGQTQPRVFANDLCDPGFVAASSYYKLGVQAPDAAATIDSFTAGGTDYRAYIYTYVSRYGEEGCPSAVVEATTWDGSTQDFVLSAFSCPAAGYALQTYIGANYPKLRLYRTSASGSGVAEFLYVDEQDYTLFDDDDTYDDGDVVIYDDGGGDLFYLCINNGTTCAPDDAVNGVGGSGADHWELFTWADTAVDTALGEVLPSENWSVPNASLKGLISLPNGSLVGFANNTVYLSEPFLPHAWPTEYSFPHDIVALGALGTTVVVLTEGYPFLLYGDLPDQMTPTKLLHLYPCLSKRSVAAGENNIFYASHDGLIRIDQNGAEIVTKDFLTTKQWNTFGLTGLVGVFYSRKYFGFHSGTADYPGFILDFTNNTLTSLSDSVNAAHIVEADGKLFVAMVNAAYGDGSLAIYEWEGEEYNFYTYNWKSKRFQINFPINFAVARVVMATESYDDIQALVVSEGYLQETNATLFNPLLEDMCTEDNTADWSEITGTVAFDTDHYEMTHSTTNAEINMTALTFASGEEYQVCVDLKDGTAAGATVVFGYYNGTSWVDSSAFTTTASWIQFRHTVAATASTAVQKFRIKVTSDLASGNIELRNIIVYNSAEGDNLGTINLNPIDMLVINGDGLIGQTNVYCNEYVTFKLYEGGILKHTEQVSNATPFRLPSGFTGTRYDVQVSGNIPVRVIEFATSMAELKENN